MKSAGRANDHCRNDDAFMRWRLRSLLSLPRRLRCAIGIGREDEVLHGLDKVVAEPILGIGNIGIAPRSNLASAAIGAAASASGTAPGTIKGSAS